MWVRVNIYPGAEGISVRQSRILSPAVQQAPREMSCQLLLLLLTVAACVSSTDGQAAYDQLPDAYKKGVDLALEQLKSHASIQHHFLFFKSLSKSSTEYGFSAHFINHNFYLKPTKCSKDTVDPNPKRCPFRNDRPLIDCGVCYKIYSGEIEGDPKPYVNCVHKPALTQDMKTKRKDHCDKLGYNSGTMTLLGSKKDN